MVIALSAYLALSAVLFTIGLVGIMTQTNAIKILMSVEIMLNSANLNLVAFSSYNNDMSGQVFVLFSIAIAAAEAVVGFAILMNLYKHMGSIELDKINIMRW